MDCSLLNLAAPLMNVASDVLLLAQETAGDAESKGISSAQIMAIVVGIAVLIVPFILGSFLAKQVKMPTYGTRFGFILLAVITSVVVLVNKRPDQGVDLKGGTILTYEIDTSKAGEGKTIMAEDFIQPLTERINPAGTKEIVLRPYGQRQLEIIIPEVDQREVDQIKNVIAKTGILQFAIVANRSDHIGIINAAEAMASSEKLSQRLKPTVTSPDETVEGIWVEVGRESEKNDADRPLRIDVQDFTVRDQETGRMVVLPPETLGGNSPTKVAQWLDREDRTLEILMIINPKYNVLGGDLSHSSSTFDEVGRPAISFNLNDKGSGKFAALTTANLPEGTRKRLLGIVMDDKLLSAPSINSTITKQGQITGSFTREEVDELVGILQAGALPAALNKTPIAENAIDATLGEDTINKGLYAIGVSLGLVLIFILFYYRFSGVVACIALLLNLAMILATMVLISQPLSLPGLAGLVLTVGMSVDANVLIFERIREEVKKGAKDRMAVRNGFAKATITIVDANLTTLITAFVLYAIGTDQIRGFAVTLILGILYSMFTAIYMSRTLFDFAERRGFLSLSMSDSVNSIRSSLAGGGQFDFISKGKFSLVFSAILVACGIAALFIRGGSMLDIDFAGGSSVQFRVASQTDTETVRKVVGDEMNKQSEGKTSVTFTVNGVSIDGAEPGTIFKVDSSFPQVNDLKSAVQSAFEASEDLHLVSYVVDVKPGAADSSFLMPTPDFGNAMLAIAQDEDEDTTVTPASDAAETESTEGDEPTAEEEAQPAEEASSDAESTDEAPAMESTDLVYLSRTISLGVENSEEASRMNATTLKGKLIASAEEQGVTLTEGIIQLQPEGEGAEDWTPNSDVPFKTWSIGLPLDAEVTDGVIGGFASSLASEPVWMSSSSVGGRVAGDMVSRALGALFASLLCIIGYIWFRFQRVIFGFAAVAALLHDVFVTLGAIAVSFYVAKALGAGFLGIEEFKISLTVVAALLTIIGYSLNDTIVVFDRIRETKGKSPRLTGEMINTSINQTLSRTLLTSITTLIVVLLLYAFGGDGIHAFAFALVVGVMVGTYSSIFVASPILLWLVNANEKKAA